VKSLLVQSIQVTRRAITPSSWQSTWR